MAINKKLIHFKNKQTFELEVANNNILDTSIVFIQDTLEIYTHGLYYTCKNWSEGINNLLTQINTLVSGNASTAIESFNEIIAFLENIEDSESLDGIIAGIEQQIAAKQDKITNNVTYSGTLTSGQVAVYDGTAGKIKSSGFTINKSVPADAKFTDTVYTLPVATSSALGGVKSGGDVTISSAGVITVKDDSHAHVISNVDGLQTALDAKQATISDLATIRSGASAGATAVQPDDLATVATSGNYNDLTDKPTIPTVNNATLTIQKNEESVGTFTANASTNKTINITVPTKVSELTNDSGYKTTDNNTTYTFTGGTNKFTVTPSGGTAQTVTVTPSITVATTDVNGLMSSSDKSKLDGISTGAEANQNAFANVKVGDTTIAADAKQDTLTLVAGSNVTLTPDATNDKITITATDTTYSAATTSADGLMSSEDKTKLDGIAEGANKYTHPSYTARTGKPTANATPAFGGTFTVSQITSNSLGHVTGATDRTITIPSTTATTSAAGLMSSTDKTKLDSIATGAQVNTITGVKGSSESSYRTGNVSISASNIGLGNVNNTSDADKPISDATQEALDAKQATIIGAATTIASSNLTASRALISNSSGKVAVSAVTSTELGYLDGVTSAIQTQLNAKAALASPTLTGTPKAPTAANGTNTTQIATTAFVQNEIANKIAAADAMIYKGTIGTDGTITALPDTHSIGWTYKVITAGTYAGQTCGVGDMIICLNDGTAASDSDWTVVQNNVDLVGTNGSVGLIKNGSSVTSTSGLTASPIINGVPYYKNTTYSAGKGLTLSSTTFNVGAGTGISVGDDTVSLAASGVTAGTYGDDEATRTLTHSDVFDVPQITVDAYGRVTAASTKTLTLPASGNTDTKVTQTVTTTNAAYPLLLAPSGQTATATTTSYFDSGVTLNPSTNTIAANISGTAATATTATKVGSSTVGSATQPVYINSGTPTACTYTLGKSVPSNAVFTDTHYTTGIRAGASETNSNATTTNPYIKVLDNTTYRSQIRLIGSGATSISSDASGNITISSTDTTYSAATTSTAGLMSAADKTKLDGIATGANKYSLPAAGSSLGGVKTGGDVTISSGVITVNDDSHNHTIANVDGLQTALNAAHSTKSATTAATAGWYRIATSAAGISRVEGTFRIEASVSGKHTICTLIAGTNYGVTSSTNISVLHCSHYSSVGISKARIVYHTTYNSNYAYLEVYVPTATATTIAVDLVASAGWTLVAPNTAGSIPSGYLSKEATLTSGTIYSESFSGSGASLSSLNASNISSGTIAAARLPVATTSAQGGIKIGYTLSGKNYPVLLSDGKAYVNVPWTDNNTTYSAEKGITLSSGKFGHSNAAITAGTAGTSNATNGSTLAVPYVTYDAYGHITAAGTHTHTISGFLTSHLTIKQDGVTGATANRYAACSTAAATAAKTASVTAGTFNLEAGARVSVKFANANTAGTPTLNINSKGAKNIFHKGAQITTGSNKALLAGVVDFIYDGTQWHLVGNYIDTNTTYSSKAAASGGTDVSLVTTGEKATWNAKTSNTGTVTSIATGAGLTGGTITGTGTIKAKLKSETASTLDSAAMGSTASRQYAVGVDKSGYLSVNVPWSNTTYSSKAAASGGTDVSLVTTGEKYTWNSKASTAVATTDAAGLMSAADKTKLNYTNIAYGTCSTAAATAAKVISVSGNSNWALTAGSVIVVKFTYTNTAANPTFNVNSTGAKSVWYNTALITSSNLSYAGYANRPMEFMYDGTQFVFIGWSVDTNSTYSNASLGQGYGTCSTDEATTAKVVTLSSYSLATGGIVAVKFTYGVPANSTMNINGKGAKSIYHNGAAITAGVIEAGDIATFIYSTQYHLIAISRATAKATTSKDGLMSSEDKTKLNGIASGATAVSESTVSGWGFTKNTGTITGIKMNGSTKGTSGVVDLGTVITAHQDISGKLDSTTAANTYATKTALENKQDKNLYFTNKTASSWVSDSTYSDYPYRCDLACSGVLATDFAEVVYDVAESTSGDYAPVCDTKANIVSIWSTVNTTIVIPTIKISK